MFLRLKRTLMNAADSGSGNGATQPAPAPEPAPQAQGDAVTLSKAELDEMISSAAKQAAKAAHDAAFAEARRTFTDSKKNKPAKTDEPAAPTAAPLSATEERMFLRGLDRELAKLGIAPNSAQYARAERDLLSDRPDDVGAWAKDYFDGFGGGAKPQPQPSQTAPQPKPDPVAPHPVSNRGAPPTATVPLEEADLVTMSDADRRAWIASKGPREYVKQLQKQLKGRNVAISGRR